MGDLTGALNDYNEVIAQDASHASAYNNRGLTYADMFDFTKAVADFDDAIRLDPEFRGAYRNRANAHKDLLLFPKALDDYGAAIRLEPTNALNYAGRGLLFVLMGRPDEAERDIDRAVEFGIPETAFLRTRQDIQVQRDAFRKGLTGEGAATSSSSR